MNFLFVSSSKFFGGGERYIVNLGNELVRRGHSVTVYNKYKIYFHGLIVTNELSRATSKFDYIILNGSGSLLRYIFKVIKYSNSECKLFYVQHAQLLNFEKGYILGILRGVLIYCLMHFVDLNIKVSRTVFPSNPLLKSKTIHNAIDTSVNYSINKPDKNLCFNICMIGRLESNKGQLKCLKLLKGTIVNYNINFHLYGTGEDYIAINQYLIENNLQDKVILHSFIDKIDDALQNMHLLISYSSYEALPFSILEAMYYRVAVIAKPIGGIPEIISDGKNGLFTTDVSISTDVVKLIEDGEFYQRLTENGYQTIIEKFDIKIKCDEFLEATKEGI